MHANPKTDRVLPDLCDAAYITNAAFVFRQIRSSAERTLFFGFSPINWRIRVATKRKRVMLVIVQLQLVAQVRIAGLQDLSGLLRHLRPRPQLQQSLRERRRCLVIFQLEEHI